MSQEQGQQTRGERREGRLRKRRYAPRIHGKRLAEIVRNALGRRAKGRGSSRPDEPMSNDNV